MAEPPQFNIERWCLELGERLDAFASKVQPLFAFEFPEEQPLPNVLPIPVAKELARRRYRKLGQRMQHDPGAEAAFWRARLRFDEADVGDILASLRGHPTLRRALTEGDSDPEEAVLFLSPFGSWSRVEMKTLALQLTRLTFKTNGRKAARLLSRFLTEGAARNLGGCEVTLIWGLRSVRRIDIGGGVYLAPYKEVAAIHGPHPLAHDDWSQRSGSSMAHRQQLLRETPENVTALVREFKWGPATAPISEAAELSGLPTVRLLDAADGGVFPPSEDNERIKDLLSIATERHQLSGGQYAPVDRWLSDIDPNYRYSWNSDRGSLNDWWQTSDLSRDSAQIFLEMVAGWADYKGRRELLDSAIRQLATLYSRVGRSGTSDRILDAATALEVMYGLSAPEISYKLRVRAAFFLGQNTAERHEIFDKVRTFYDARSGVIHGGSRHRRRDFDEALADGLAIARSTLSPSCA